jgi:uncharacterized membrane protein YkvA (DUF1232 family)
MRIEGWKKRASNLKKEVRVLALAIRDRRTPWYARILAVLIVAYALSPIDLIPDPIPVLGYLDDIVIVPVGVAIVLRLIPVEVMHDARARAVADTPDGRWFGRVGLIVIISLWLVAIGATAYIALRLWHSW